MAEIKTAALAVERTSMEFLKSSLFSLAFLLNWLPCVWVGLAAAAAAAAIRLRNPTP